MAISISHDDVDAEGICFLSPSLLHKHLVVVCYNLCVTVYAPWVHSHSSVIGTPVQNVMYVNPTVYCISADIFEDLKETRLDR